jgi:hypothetical protein
MLSYRFQRERRAVVSLIAAFVGPRRLQRQAVRLSIELGVWKDHQLLRMVGNPPVSPTPAQQRAAPPALAGD